MMYFLSTFSLNEDPEVNHRYSELLIGVSLFAASEGPFKNGKLPPPPKEKLIEIHKQYKENEEEGGGLEKLHTDDIILQKYENPGESDLISNETGYMSSP